MVRSRVLVLSMLVFGSLFVTAAPASAAVYVPGQFIAKQYSEALGRLPDQDGWTGQSNYIAANGCNAPALATVGNGLYTSTEFTGRGYNNSETVLTLYRGALNREPDQSGFDYYVALLNTGTSWPTVVQSVFSSTEFANLVPTICSGVVDGSGSSYYWGTYPPLALTPVGSGFSGSQTDLQALLNSTPPGGTVYLARDAVISLPAPLTIPSGVTLATAGAPDPYHYAAMARLVRTGTWNDALVYVSGGAALTNVWVDGQRNTPSNNDPSRPDVRVLGGNGTTLTNDRLDNTQGAQTVQVLGSFDGYPCAGATVSYNLITAYSSDHLLANDWTDGVAATCEHTTVSYNQIVDTSDAAIVLYRSSPYTANVVQASQVMNNWVLSAGNSMYVALAADPLYEAGAQAPRTYDFTGSSIANNTVWTSPNTHFDIGLADGTRAWGFPNADTGTGASIANNTTGSLNARVLTGIGISGMLQTTVTGNTTTWVHGGGWGTPGCPDVDMAASISAGTASGTFSPTPVDIAFDGCIGSSH